MKHEKEIMQQLEDDKDKDVKKYLSQMKKLERNVVQILKPEVCLELMLDLKEESYTSSTQLLNYRFLCNFLNQ